MALVAHQLTAQDLADRRLGQGSPKLDSGGHFVFGQVLATEGDEFVLKYATGSGAKAYHRFSSDIFFEAHAGRAPIFWDLDSVTPEAKKRMIANQEAKGLKMHGERCGIDIIKGGKLDVFDGAAIGHSGLGCGGVRLINTKCESTIPGLYAVGDTAGTDSLTDCMFSSQNLSCANVPLGLKLYLELLNSIDQLPSFLPVLLNVQL